MFSKIIQFQKFGKIKERGNQNDYDQEILIKRNLDYFALGK